MLFYNLDQIVCVGACVGEVKKQARKFRIFISFIKLAIAFFASQRASYLKEIKFEN